MTLERKSSVRRKLGLIRFVDIFRRADTMSRMGSSKAGRRARRRFSDEFMAGAVRLVLDEGMTISAVARDLDLTPSSLANWVQHAHADRKKRGPD